LKELKIYAITMKIVENKQHYNVIRFWNDWKSMNGHASWNVSNKQQNFVDGTLINLSPFPSPYSSPPLNDSNGPSIEVTSLDPYTLMTIFIKMLTHVLKLTKGEITTTNFRNMAI
jgi:hypothetical protein